MVMMESSSTPWSSAQAVMTAPSFTQYTRTSETPLAFRSSSKARYPGTCVLDQVGVKTPGRPTSTTFLPLQNSATGKGSGGKPLSRLIAGMASPTLALADTAGARDLRRPALATAHAAAAAPMMLDMPPAGAGVGGGRAAGFVTGLTPCEAWRAPAGWRPGGTANTAGIAMVTTRAASRLQPELLEPDW